MEDKATKYLFLSDQHFCKENKRAISALRSFILDFAPDTVFLMGDLVNFDRISSFIGDPYDKTTISDEVARAKEYLQDVHKLVHKVNESAKIIYIQGNHEFRLMNFLSRNAEQLADLQVKGEHIVTIEHIFELRELGIECIPYMGYYMITPDVMVKHGDTVRKDACYTAKAEVEKNGVSVIIGHTHRQGLFRVRKGLKEYFAMEVGCLANLSPSYQMLPNWQNGFAIGYSYVNNFYPYVIPIIDNSFVYGDKVYRPTYTVEI